MKHIILIRSMHYHGRYQNKLQINEKLNCPLPYEKDTSPTDGYETFNHVAKQHGCYKN